MECPKCHVALDQSDFEKVPMQMCGECMGSVVLQRDLVPLLSAMSAELAHTIDFDRPLEPLVSEGGPCDCPKCGKGMEKFGYMESRLVYADRCSSCWLIWTHPDELGHMAIVYARTQKLTSAIQADLDEYQDGLERRVSAMLRNRVRNRVIAGVAL